MNTLNTINEVKESHKTICKMNYENKSIEYKYEITSTGRNSNELGNCEVCSKHVSEVYIQTESIKYLDENAELQTTHYQCREGLFGHKECLESKRR